MRQTEPLNLLIFDREYESFYSCRQQKVIHGRNFMLCSALFGNMNGIINDVLRNGKMPDVDTVEGALRSFYREVNKDDEITDRPISAGNLTANLFYLLCGCDPEADEPGMISFFSEALALYGLIVTWLDPREVAGGQVNAKKWLGDEDNNFFFKQRCRQFHFNLTVIDETFTYYHDSTGLLPLCWAELLYALQNKQKASVCPFCQNVYLFPGNNYQKGNCGQRNCRKASLIHKHGGIEGYKAWETQRKKSPGGKRGRPRKTSSIE